VYAHTQVADYMESLIRSGVLAPDARLPGERALAEEYRVALGTIRRAIEELRRRALVVTLPSKGTYVASLP